MKKHYLTLLILGFSLTLFAQEKLPKKLSFGFNIWNEISSKGGFQYTSDTTTSIFRLKTSSFSSIKPFIGYQRNEQTSWQFGISTFYIDKDNYNNFNYRNGANLNPNNSNLLDGYTEFRYSIEGYSTYKLQTKKKYLPAFFLQATFGITRTRNKPLISERFPVKTFDVGSTLSPGFEYYVNLSKKVIAHIGCQMPLLRLRYNYIRNEVPSWSINTQRAFQLGFTTYELLYPQLRLGISYKS
ncbi:MAG: hypothetical protein ACPGLV_06670 [Bacteroidia bacterium]